MGMLVVSSIFVCIIAFIDWVKGIRNYAKNYKSKKIVPENFNSDQRKTPNSVVSHINLNNNSRLYQSQTMTEAQEPRYVSSVIESNHKLEEVKRKNILYQISLNLLNEILKIKINESLIH